MFCSSFSAIYWLDYVLLPIRELARRNLGRDRCGRGAQRAWRARRIWRARAARAGARESQRVGGACTIEEPFPGVRMSPCAYLAGLLHPLVVEELELPRRGFQVDARGERAVCAISRWHEHSAVGR